MAYCILLCHSFESKCTLSARTYCRDYAATNSCMLMHASTHTLCETCTSDMPCMLHTCKHVETAVVTTSDFNEMGWLMAMCNALAQRGYYMRLLQTVKKYVAENLAPLDIGEPPAGATEYSEMVAQHMIDAEQWDKADVDTKRRKNLRNKTRAIKKYEENWRMLPKLLNGKWWVKGKLVHICKNQACCKNRNRDLCVRKVTQCLLRTIFVRRPPSPASIKWTKFGPCTDFIFAGCACHNLLPEVYRLAFDKLSAKMVSQSVLTIDHQRLHTDLAQDMDWGPVNGRRMQDQCSFFGALGSNPPPIHQTHPHQVQPQFGSLG